MKRIKNILAVATLAMVIGGGVNVANAGLLISDLTGNSPEPCTESTNSAGDGIIVHGIVGIIVHGLTGIIVHGAGDTQENCGIIVHG